MNSTHKILVVPLVLEKHPNADSLSIVRVWDYTVCARTEDWQGKKLAAYIPPDSLVDTRRPEFSWLAEKATDNKYRVKAMKMRGIVSFGMLVPIDESQFKEGDDVTEYLGVEHYNPPEPIDTSGEASKAPEGLGHLGKYDLEAYKKYKNVFVEGEEVWISEKLHGANSRFVFNNGKMYCGSHSEWKKEIDSNLWWRILKNNKSIRECCEFIEGMTLYGEAYGWVQSLRYGAKQGEIFFRAFDIQDKQGKFFDTDLFLEVCEKFKIPVVPTIYRGPLKFDEMLNYAEGKTLIPGANHVREGCVIKPVKERWDARCGRVALKLVGAGYYLTEKG